MIMLHCLHVMPYIFFFKIKNCLNENLYISCDDRTGKMLHNICISAVAMSLRCATRGPWASCFGTTLFSQIMGISMGTNCAPLVADWLLFCYERDLMQIKLSFPLGSLGPLWYI